MSGVLWTESTVFLVAVDLGRASRNTRTPGVTSYPTCRETDFSLGLSFPGLWPGCPRGRACGHKGENKTSVSEIEDYVSLGALQGA